MMKLVIGVVIEVLVGTMIAGLILALAIPLLNRSNVVVMHDATSQVVIISVLIGAVALALFRPGSAIRRYMRR
jgi:hypothetical protein